MYQTDRQADAEAIVRILHEVTDDDRSAEGYCCLCGEITPDDSPEVHGESCPFGMADEFIAKYGTHPPADCRPRMTLPEMIDEVYEKTHLPMIEVLNLIEGNWPGHETFTPTQCNLLVSLIGRKKQEMQS